MARRIVVVMSAFAASLSGGCGTYITHSPYLCADDAKRDRVYSGVRWELDEADRVMGPVVRGEDFGPRAVADAIWWGGVCLVDLPMCAVADTLLLPRTLERLQIGRAACRERVCSTV